MTDLSTLFSNGAASLDWRHALVSTLLAYVLGQAIAWVYARTYSGMSYSRSMVQTLVVGGIVSAMLMLAIGNSLARGIGIVGTLALIRFRTNLRDPLDMVFVFASFGAGIASGTGSWGAGIVGTGVFLAVVALMRVTGFGSFREYDGVVRLRLPAEETKESELERVLRATCVRFALVTLRETAQGDTVERAYHVTLKDPDDQDALVRALRKLGAEGVALSFMEATVEL